VLLTLSTVAGGGKIPAYFRNRSNDCHHLARGPDKYYKQLHE